MSSVVLRIEEEDSKLTLASPPRDLARSLARDLGVDAPEPSSRVGGSYTGDDLAELIRDLASVDAALERCLDAEGEPMTAAGGGRNYFNRREQLRATIDFLRAAQAHGRSVEVQL